MKSILVGPKEKVEREQQYPFLGIAKDGAVVLFTSFGSGTIVHTTNVAVNPLGEYHERWIMPSFVPLKGKITLHN